MPSLPKPSSRLAGWLLAAICALAAILMVRGITSRRTQSAPPPVAAYHGQLGVTIDVPDPRVSRVGELEQAVRLGAQWIRFELPWSEVEPSEGQADWSRWDPFVARAHAEGLSILVVLDSAPAWARSSAEQDRAGAPPADYARFAAFAGRVAERYRGQITAYQVWDQPNLEGGWGKDGPNPADYAALLSATHKAIKAADGAALVVAGGLAPTTEVSPRNLSDVAFLERMLQAGALPYFDVLGAKPFGFWSDADAPADAAQTNYSRAILLYNVLAQHGGADKPVWAVEFGWAALPAGWTGAPAPWGSDTEEKQGARAQAAVHLAQDGWPWMGPVFWARMAPPASADDPAAGFALVDRNLQPRALFSILAAVAADPAAIGPGEHSATADAAAWTGGWRFSPLGADVDATGDSVTIPFSGTGLSLRLRQGDFCATLYVEVDGAPAPALPRDEKGRAYIVLYNPTGGAVDVPVASGLSDGTHAATVTAEGGWGQWALAGWVVSGGAQARSRLALVAPVLLVLLALAGTLWLLRRYWAPTISRLLDRAARLPAWVPVAALAVAAGLLLTGRLPAVLLGCAILALLAATRLEFALCGLAASLPFYPHALPLAGRQASVSLVVLAAIVAGFCAAWAVRWCAADGRHAPRCRIRALCGADLAVIALVVVGIASLAASEHLGVSIRELLQVVIAACAAYGLVRALPERASLWPIADGLVIGATAISVLGIVQFATGSQLISAEGVMRVRGLYGSPNNLALFLDRTAPLAFTVAVFGGRRRRIPYAASAAIQFLACILTFSRGAWLLGLPAALLFIGIVRRGRALWALLVAVAATIAAAIPFAGTARFSSLFSTSQGTTFLRLSLWRSALAMIRDHPLQGVGLDNFLYLYRSHYILPSAWSERDLSHPHNLVLDWWLRLGLLGLLVGAWLVAAFAAAAARAYRATADAATRALVLGLSAGLVASLAHGLIDQSFFLTDLATVFMLSLGTVAVLARRGRNGNTTAQRRDDTTP